MNPTPELIRDIIKAAGGASAIAAVLQIRSSAVNNWPQRGYIPAAHCPTLERLSAGAYRCEQMRPDVEWAVLRGSPVTFSSSAALTP
ncbi:YdaS family helix-turn-helix protein [Chromobacterium haemolyticum]|uniref:YdaS family helix-turn-helix protein n=1 Tax=Chromobacterium haemolyticum TaxID=394935 RepID=UPI001746F8E3|nr:YdaS family helix-turn-helix protein [Chromobacterium haemolyticum]QOD81870.1 helix-turn-helix domain-containing protein [Chromobacterium haemolyticum]